jgi:hypothetical protein
LGARLLIKDGYFVSVKVTFCPADENNLHENEVDITLYMVCGNKMPSRCNRCFLLQILLLAQYVSGTIMPIIRSSRVLYSWLLPVVFDASVFKLSVWCGAESCVPAAARKPDTQPSAPHHTDNLKTEAPNTTGNNQLYNTLELLMRGIKVPETS